MNSDFDSATYSAEDNKLRLYINCRLDDDVYKEVISMGFKSAPKQELFFAPAWTPKREDFCLTLVEEITLEDTTVAERAEAKIARLNVLQEMRAGQADSFHNAANKISQKMHNNMDTVEVDNYWAHKSVGVRRHANRKSNAGVRARRIKKLLAGLRDKQRSINNINASLERWKKLQVEEVTDQEVRKSTVEFFLWNSVGFGDLYTNLGDGEVTCEEVVDKCVEKYQSLANDPHHYRWITHILNRLAYEKGEQGPTSRFEGEMTAVVIQAFTREHGAEKPKAKQVGEAWEVSSTAPLPLHIAEGKTLALSDGEWRDLMQGVGYEHVVKERKKSTKPKPAPLVNPTEDEAETLQALWNEQAIAKRSRIISGSLKVKGIQTMEQAKFSTNSKGEYSKYEVIELDEDGNKIWHSCRGNSPEPVCRIRVNGKNGGGLHSPESIIVLTDKPQKPLPITFNIKDDPAKEA